MTIRARLITLLLAGLVPFGALAARGDSEQPVSIEANRGSIDNRKNVHVFEGGVVLSQGSLVIRCDKLVVTQDADGFKHGVASGGDGGRAAIRQQREGRDDFVEGRATRIEYDARTRKAILVGKAEVKSGGDEVRGEYIEYDGATETYLVTNSKTPEGSEGGGRVRAIIQPRESNGEKSP
ncbi:MAG: lipopolysaccharide transport periplasmic protein LptA [Rhodocyclaceae bacterium]|nr:lipopolysaccharide transport periplasmic protein LptA [Rhodocyclaceae bacterium]